MPIDIRTVLRRWFDEVWNSGREETVDELLAHDAVAHGLGEGEDVQGPAGFKQFLRNMRSAFPDGHIRIEDMIGEGDKAAVRVVLEGTHLGDSLGLARTGRSVNVTGLIITRVSNGQIIEGWNCWDQLGLLRQLGADPSIQAKDRFLSPS